MAFEQGNTFGTGRPAGVPNKVTQHTRELVTAFVEKRLEDAERDFALIDSPYDRLALLAKFLPFVIPKCRELSGEVETRVDVVYVEPLIIYGKEDEAMLDAPTHL